MAKCSSSSSTVKKFQIGEVNDAGCLGSIGSLAKKDRRIRTQGLELEPIEIFYCKESYMTSNGLLVAGKMVANLHFRLNIMKK